MIEKRKSPRFALSAEIHWKRADGACIASEPLMSRTRDLSTGGMSLVLEPGVAEGDTLELEIRLPGGPSIYSRGRVAWISTQAHIKGWAVSLCEAGVELMNLSESEKTHLDSFIAESL